MDNLETATLLLGVHKSLSAAASILGELIPGCTQRGQCKRKLLDASANIQNACADIEDLTHLAATGQWK